MMIAAFVMMLTYQVQALGMPQHIVYNNLTADTTKPGIKITPRAPDSLAVSDTIPIRDSMRVQKIDTFSLKLSKDTLDAPVNYEAEDSAVILASEKRILLYGKTKTVFKDVTLTAPRLELDQQTSILTAYNEKDSSGEVATRARFEQGDNKFDSDTIRYNFKSQQGLTKNTFTQQNEMFIHGESIKKVSPTTVYIKKGRFTTCDLDHPHFSFVAGKLKVVNNKVAISGPMHPEFEGVPVPIYLPFGYYPLSKGRHSGVLAPQVTATENYGIGLEGLGYYKVLSENIDATLRTNIYSYGGWLANLSSMYTKRYRYNGNVGFSLQSTKINFRGDPDYQNNKSFQVNWSHGLDQRARPGLNFRASVMAGSSRYNRYITNNAPKVFNNQMSSSIAFSRNWTRSNLQLNANHSQNNQTRQYNISLPEASFSLNTLNPLRRKVQVGGDRWYEKLGIGYNGTLKNTFSFFDSSFSGRELLENMLWNANHSIPVTLSLPSLGPLMVAPGFSYQENWIMKKAVLQYNPAKGAPDTTIKSGFYTARNMALSLSLNTAVFGLYTFRNSNVQAIRHTMRPTVSMSYSPNLAKGYHRTVQVDSFGRMRNYSFYSGYGYNNVEFGGLSFGLENNLEMKVRDKKDSAGGKKIVRLIEGFGFNGNYNFLADSQRLSNMNFNLRSSLFEKVHITFNAMLSPYERDSLGRTVFAWKDGFSAGHIINGSISLNSSFKSKPRDPSKPAQATPTNPNRNPDPGLTADQQSLQDYMRRNPSEFVDFNIPYDFSFDFTLNFGRQQQGNLPVFKTVVDAYFNFRNSFSLTPKWNFSTQGYLDMKTFKLNMFTMAINREMHCWQLSIAATPVGLQRYFNISISPKSSLLQNLKVNRTRQFNDF